MKKALSVFLMTALAFGAFAQDAEPVADVNIAEFSGNAAVQWGVDLDSGTTGFKNSYEVNLKLNLLNNGSKSTTGDGVWGELVLKTEEDTFIGWENGDDSPEVGDKYINANTGLMGDGCVLGLKVYVDVAKIHIGPAYIGIKRGDTQTGELKMDAPIRSADSDNALTLGDVGPKDYSEGIVAGYDSDMFKIDLDLRSKPAGTYYYTDNYAFALEGEFKGVENMSAKAGISYNFAKNYQSETETTIKTAHDPDHTLGYSASVGYKLGLNDTFFLRPQIGFAGSTGFNKDSVGDVTTKTSDTTMTLAGGLLLGWGDIGQDKNADVYFLDNDDAKKVTPGVGVVVDIPLPSIGKTSISSDVLDMEVKEIETDFIAARIVPSFYSGELIPGLTAAAYADIWLLQDSKTKTTTTIDGESETETVTTKNDSDNPMAFAFGLKYAIGVEEMTITPQVGLRFMNAEYVNGNNGSWIPVEKLFDDTHYNKGETVAGDDYLNLKLGVDVAGLIDNTTLSVLWSTRNLINDTDLANRNDPKLGTLDFKAKIAL